MGAESWGYGQSLLPSCVNCGHRTGRRAQMSDSRWRNLPGVHVCSRACGERLDSRIEHGMHPPIKEDSFGWYVGGLESSERVHDLRLRIKVLENRVRRARSGGESAGGSER